jgi:hypothetical protein
VIISCRPSSPKAAAAPPLPSVAVDEVPAPSPSIIVVERGSNLRAISAAAYGHERFSGFVAALNGISDPERIIAGTTLKTPSLSAAFRDAGLDSRYQPAINALAKASTDFHATLPTYLKARSASGVASGTFTVPADTRATFMACADAIVAASAVLGTATPPHSIPKMTISQFLDAAGLIRELASGSIDGYGYDYDLVGQRFGLAFTNAIVWTQQHHREPKKANKTDAGNGSNGICRVIDVSRSPSPDPGRLDVSASLP